MAKRVWKEETPLIIKEIMEIINQADDFCSGSIEALVKQHVERKGLGLGRVMTPLRLLLVGSGMGPHLFDIMELIGKEEALRRLETGLDRIA
jgi:glutamyl-tRNA synthetase